jgi:YYY domain-containing protein
MAELIAWWLALEVIGVAALPLTAVLFGNLPDRGLALAKPAALLIFGWLVWAPLATISALPYSRGWILAVFVVFAAGNVALLRLPEPRATLRRMLLTQRAYLITAELVFTGAFALMAWLRSFTPAVVDTEKFMDVAFISSLWRTPHLPAPDPWLSGEPINYYYFGHFLIATLAKALGTQPGTAFNIGVAAVFALAAMTVFAVAANIFAVARRGDRALVRALPAGLLAVVLVLVVGNLNGAQVWWANATSVVRQQPALLSSPWGWWLRRDLWLGYDWWSPSRAVPNTITEFPSFSFVLADLHAHVLALPFAALAVGVAFNLLLARGEGLRAFGHGLIGVLTLVGTATLIGGLYAINGWDLPTYLGLTLLALVIQQWLAHGRRASLLLLLDLCAVGVMLVALCFLLYLPFYRGFVSPSQGFALVAPADRSAIGYEVAMFGLPVFVLGSLLVLRLARGIGGALRPTAGDAAAGGGGGGLRRWLDGRESLAGAALVGVGAGALALWTATTQGNLGWTLFWALLLVLGCAAVVLRRVWPAAPATATTEAAPSSDRTEADAGTTGHGELWVYLLFGTAAALVAAAELVYLRDIFGIRMNTVFKLYFQAWLLLGLAAGPALIWLLDAARHALAQAATQTRRQWSTAPAPPALRPGALALAAAGDQPLDRPLRHLPPLARFFSRLAPMESSLAPRLGGASTPASARAPGLPPALRWLRAGGIVLWMGVLVALVAAALVYPVLATSAHTQNFSLPRTLDGTAYMAADSVNAPPTCTVGGGSNHGDNLAIAWLNTHVSGSPVLLEAPGCEWSHFSRVSAFTGLPTILGWPGGHEAEWRANWLALQGAGDILAERADAINTIYTSDDQATVLELLRRYEVRYVYVGVAERALYPNADLHRFAAFLRLIYNRDGVTIYQVP